MPPQDPLMDSDSIPVASQGGLGNADPERTVVGSWPVPMPAALPPGSALAEYEVQAVIGQGGFGIVYLAWDRVLECRFAIKEYMPSRIAVRGADSNVSLKSALDREIFDIGLRSFVNEAQLLAGFDHPALVKVYRFWHANSTAYMLMPYYEGPTLKEVLDAGTQKIDEAWLRALLVPLTGALGVLHARQCYHRDIAPDNLKLRADSGAPVLLDFGAARRVIEGAKRELTAIYKPGYAPIEQREDSGMEQGPWTDVYALAAMLHRAIAGELPPSPLARLETDRYVPLSQRFQAGYSRAFLEAIDRALGVRPADRTRSIEQFCAELGLEGGCNAATSNGSAPGHAWTADGPGARPPSPAPNRRGVLALAGVSLAAVAMGAWQWRPRVVAGRVAESRASEPASASVLPAPASALPAPPPPTQAPSEPETPFARIVAASTPGFGVDVQARRTRLRVDRDPLEVTLRSSRDGYVYVLLLDADGSFLLVFPNASTRELRIRRDTPLELPRLMARKPTGRERFLAIVSRWPRDIGRAGRKDDLFRRMDTTDRGLASAVVGRAICADTRDCTDEYGAASFELEVVSG